MHPDQPDWRLREWLAYFQKNQASLTRELGWNKQKANYAFHGRQEYRREMVNQVAAWLGIEPFELLMRPSEALALRRLRETAALIVAEDAAPFEPPPAHRTTKTGTKG